MSFICCSVAVTCESYEFDCFGDGQSCIPAEKLCDDTQDCTNGADESQDQCPTKSMLFF